MFRYFLLKLKIGKALLGKRVGDEFFVETKKDFDLKLFNDHLHKKLEEYKIPEKIIEIDNIPRIPGGKILRKALEMNKI